MMFDRLRSIPADEVDIHRLMSAAKRRLINLPHALSWNWGLDGSAENRARIRALRNSHHGQRCFVIGNGPSLSKMNLESLRQEFTFGLNRIYLLFPKIGFETTYWVGMNELVIRQSIDEIERLKSSRFLNWRARGFFDKRGGHYFLREVFRPHFAMNVEDGLWVGATVTYATLQLAFHMGFRQVILIGVDHHYSATGTPHKILEAKGSDPDHFDSSYFDRGTRWQLPDLATSEYAYRLARATFTRHGREIIDATVGGRLEVFPKAEFDRIVGGS